jgi:hypothetical protein
MLEQDATAACSEPTSGVSDARRTVGGGPRARSAFTVARSRSSAHGVLPTRCKRGRPPKDDERPKPGPTRLERQVTQNLSQMLADLPTACDVGCKKNSKGDKETWTGYKLHIDVDADQCLTRRFKRAVRLPEGDVPASDGAPTTLRSEDLLGKWPAQTPCAINADGLFSRTVAYDRSILGVVDRGAHSAQEIWTRLIFEALSAPASRCVRKKAA